MTPKTQTRPALDMPLLAAIVILCALSLLVQYSAGGENPAYLTRQGARMALALALLFVFAHIPPAQLQRWSPWLYAGGLALLVVVLSIGIVGKGAQRWLDLGVARVQPSEAMKLAVPMFTAWVLTRLPLPPRLFTALCALAAVALPAALVVVQPDLGTAILICIAGLAVIFLAGITWKMLSVVGALAAVSAPLVWHFLLREYQQQRVLTMLDPWADPLGAGYHIVQSIIAVGAGGWRGKGWLGGSQSQLDFVPERSTDFIFATFAEEFGFIGALALIFVYLFIAIRGLIIAHYAPDSYARLLAGGLAITFFVSVFVNLGMTVGILPVVGVPLPLLSHGGSSIATLMIALGILMSVHRERSRL